MRTLLRHASPTRLELGFTESIGNRIGMFIFGGAFLFGGVVLMLAALPHREELRCTREGAGVATCEAWQLVLDRWIVSERSLLADPGTVAEVRVLRDAEGPRYHAWITGPAGEMAFGKSSSTTEFMADGVFRVNAFLSRPSATSVEVTESVFWWWVAPMGAVASFMGAALLAWGAGGERVTFDLGNGSIVRELRVIAVWRREVWPLKELRHVMVRSETDFDGDEIHRLSLEFRKGYFIDIGTPRASGSESLDAVVGELASWLELPAPHRGDSVPASAPPSKPRAISISNS